MIRLIGGILLFSWLLGVSESEPRSDEAAPPAAVEVKAATSSAEPDHAQSEVKKPSWAGKPAKLERGVYRMSVPSGLYVTRLECERALDVAMHNAVAEYVENYLQVDEARLVELDDRYIKNNIQKDEYEETVVRSVGPMQQVVALLEFDDRVRAEITNRYRTVIVRMRLWTFGSGALAVLALIGTLFGYLKLDHLTQGHHRRRLQWAAAATILGVVAGAALIQTQAFTARL